MIVSVWLVLTIFSALIVGLPVDLEAMEVLDRRLLVPDTVDPGMHAKKALPQQLNSLIPFALFAGAAYCKPETVKPWTCTGSFGQKYCTNPVVSGFKTGIAKGDGSHVQYYYVGYWPAKKAVIVAHQGTDPLKLPSVLTDLKFRQEPLNPKLFPGLPPNVAIHRGFANQHAIGAQDILNEVTKLVKEHKAQDVITVGHSLGGALATLSALMIRLHFDAARSGPVHVSSHPPSWEQRIRHFLQLEDPQFLEGEPRNRHSTDHPAKVHTRLLAH